MSSEESAALRAGTMIGRYRIVAPIGSGGMGDVYSAHDTHLDRKVAVKILPRELRADEDRVRRFVQEARAASALNHPHIISVFDAGKDEDSGTVYYIAMELIEGESLRSLLGRRGAELTRMLETLTEVADALASAHGAGIVHRDLKPDNIMVTADGYAKVLDFGLAKLNAAPARADSQIATDIQFTQPGAMMGTAGYSAPEQITGDLVDQRSDIFSFGCILYEVTTGRRPFSADSAIDTLHKVLHDEPAPISDFNASAPPELQRIIRKCLAKSRDRRYQTMKDVAIDLRSLLSGGINQKAAQPSGKSEGQRAIAVLPFTDLAADPDNAHIGLGLADATITELARVKSLLVRPTAAILKYQNLTPDPVATGHDLGVDAVVSGTFQRFGSRLRVTVQLVSTAENRSLWATRINSSLDDVFAMQDEVSRHVASALELELSAGDQARMSRVAHPTGEAYDLYLQGKLHLFTERLDELNVAIDFLKRACEEDPGFALAWASLAEAYLRLGFTFDPEAGWYERAREMCARALELDPHIPEGRYLRGRLIWSPEGNFDHAGAIREFLGAIAARPSLNQAHHWLAVVLMHINLFDDAWDAIQKALAIHPGDEVAFSHLGFVRMQQGRFEEAADLSRRASEQFPAPWTLYQTSITMLRWKGVEAAAKILETGSRQFVREPLFTSAGTMIEAARGRAAESRKLAERTVQQQRVFGHFHHAQYDLACASALLGNGDEAMSWLRASARNGYPAWQFFEKDPLLSTIRDRADFRTLMDELRLECDPYRSLYANLRNVRSA